MSSQQLACLVWVVAFLSGAAVPASALLIGHAMHTHGNRAIALVQGSIEPVPTGHDVYGSDP
jgi:hypothetical protein